MRKLHVGEKHPIAEDSSTDSRAQGHDKLETGTMHDCTALDVGIICNLYWLMEDLRKCGGEIETMPSSLKLWIYFPAIGGF
jgi:hypothetical protein